MLLLNTDDVNFNYKKNNTNMRIKLHPKYNMHIITRFNRKRQCMYVKKSFCRRVRTFKSTLLELMNERKGNLPFLFYIRVCILNEYLYMNEIKWYALMGVDGEAWRH